MAAILIVDDEHHLRESFARLLTGEGHEVRTAASGEAGLKLVKEQRFDLVVMDVRMPGMDGLTAFRAMREHDSTLPVIIMTAFGTTDTAIEATKMGAFDYILKPFDIPDMLRLVDEAVATGRAMRGRSGEEGAVSARSEGGMVGTGRAMHEVYKAIGRVAPTEALVLIRGESGTGKELAARALHRHSLRAAKPFVVINCVAIPESLLESELFGHEKGAFTGASSRRAGKIELANHGTVFLDEVGDMPLAIQAKILRLLQEKKIERLGGRQPIAVDVRILAATNRDLEAAVAEGRFREDLYYRLKVVTLTLPPLRDRKEDIADLAADFIASHSRDMDIAPPALSREALDALTAQDWPGNVRELKNTIHKALIFCRGAALGRDDILRAVGQQAEPSMEALAASGDGLRDFIRQALAQGAGGGVFEQLMDQMGKLVVREALDMTGGNRSQAARMLGLSRPTLLAKIEKYGLRIETQVS